MFFHKIIFDNYIFNVYFQLTPADFIIRSIWFIVLNPTNFIDNKSFLEYLSANSSNVKSNGDRSLNTLRSLLPDIVLICSLRSIILCFLKLYLETFLLFSIARYKDSNSFSKSAIFISYSFFKSLFFLFKDVTMSFSIFNLKLLKIIIIILKKRTIKIYGKYVFIVSISKRC